MRQRAKSVFGILLALGLASWAGAAEHPPTGAEETSTAAALTGGQRGQPGLWNSDPGERIVFGHNMEPGDSRSGGVRIRNLGSTARLWMTKRLRGRAGPNGGRLRRELRFRMVEIARGHRRVLHDGYLRRIGRVRLGTWDRREARRYKLRIHFPDSGIPPSSTTGDNAYQGSRARVRFIWRERPPR